MIPETETRADERTQPLVLLVDDVPSNLHLLAALLKRDYRVKIATSGAAALALAALDDRPDLILLDVMMPVMSGIEVLQHLRAQAATRDIPVIFVSADTSEQTQLNGFELGADDYLTKPVVGPILQTRVRNLLARQRNERQLRLAHHVFNYSGEAILVTNREQRIIETNPAFTRLTGYARAELLGQTPRLLESGRHTRREYRLIWLAVQRLGLWQGELWDRHKNGETQPRLVTITSVRNPRGVIDYYIATFSDIRAQKANEERIRHLAFTDALTGLPNRLHLNVALEQELARAARTQTEVALMFIDMDRFKFINDSHGHQVGDQLLVEVGQRIRACVRESDVVARLGGDEFVVVVSDLTQKAAVNAVASKLLHALSQPYILAGGLTTYSSPSIGVSIFPVDGRDGSTLMKHADTAMYHAKAQGRNNVQYFKAELNAAATLRFELEQELRCALEGQQFVLHYQPKVDAHNGRIGGVEALLRWQHPQRGLLAPGQFIALAEETGQIEAIGAWVLEQACAQLASWRAIDLGGAQGLTMAVNLSAQQLRSDGLVDVVRATLARYALPPDSLELEITESMAITDPDAAVERLRRLRVLGVRLAIDDFGTGYSSLAYLKHLPIQTLKLDKSFVHGIEDADGNDAAICSAAIGLAHTLGLEIVAEGVETEAQRQFLAQHPACNWLQGYLFARPKAAAELTPLLLQATAGASQRCKAWRSTPASSRAANLAT